MIDAGHSQRLARSILPSMSGTFGSRPAWPEVLQEDVGNGGDDVEMLADRQQVQEDEHEADMGPEAEVLEGLKPRFAQRLERRSNARTGELVPREGDGVPGRGRLECAVRPVVENVRDSSW